MTSISGETSSTGAPRLFPGSPARPRVYPDIPGSTRCCHVHRTEVVFSGNVNVSSSFAPSSAESSAAQLCRSRMAAHRSTRS